MIIMNNKKVLFLSVWQNYSEGGGQKYSYLLCKIFNEHDYDIKELCFYDKSKKSVREPLPFVKYECVTKRKSNKNPFFVIPILYRAKKMLKNEIRKNDYDCIIYNSNSWPGVRTNSNSIFVLHTKPSKVFDKRKELIKKILHLKNGMYFSDVVITQFDSYSNQIKKIDDSVQTKEIMPFFENNKLNIKNNNEKNNYIYYVGRTDSHEKRIDLIDEVSSKLERRIRVIGNYSSETKNKYKNLDFLGQMNMDEIYNELYKNAKAIILLSDYESLPLVSCEALSCGIPLILRDTFETASFLINKGNNGILIDKNLKPNEIANIIKSTNFNNFEKKNLTMFAKKHFSYDLFEKKWNEIINNMK